jgi:hypothetical protein
VSLEPQGPDWRFFAVGAWALVTALFSWIASSLRSEQKEHGVRIDFLQRTYVSREDLDKRLAELRADNLRMHQDNQGALERIEGKIERGAQTRHDIRDAVNAIQLQVSLLRKKDGGT